LCNTSAANAVIFDNAPVVVLFAVFLSSGHSQEHAVIVYKIQGTARG
jgi:hypothetical protein